ncbi:MAG: ACP S-malonyltransferase [SAR202 cluster bacterium]|nr:ACP S-malonyltransferase [Dehalococcoidia bacterium]MQG25571.1 ACP S-malonyltransferase [SAR202 cluster bacterium]MQG52890.1 ACP S-malonyltransferase [SAR202 cluster bacterium]|tara:strand:+ start:25394 stop:26335 length:942 start_codon:yes stop_codon:yes gene_type:complete
MEAEMLVSTVFPGQGSQVVGMGKDLSDNFTLAKQIFQEADDTLGYKLSDLMFNGPDKDLEDTSCSQPAIMAVSVACWKVLNEAMGDMKLKVQCSAGHSLGEYTSLVISGVISYSDGLRLVQERGRLMHDASVVRPGSMAAVIGLNEQEVETVCSQSGAEMANINSNDQIVISGDSEYVAEAVQIASDMGARKVITLPVSGAFHSSLMEYASDGLSKILDEIDFNDSEVPIIANSTGLPVKSADEIKEELLKGLCSCVQWKDSIQYMVNSGVSNFIEFGPSRVLSSLIKRINKEVRVESISSVKTLEQFVDSHS